MTSVERQAVSALDRALRLLGARPHFRSDLRRKLVERGYDAGEIDAALARLDELGYLDDAALARAEAERLRSSKGLARSALAAGLRRKGAGEREIDAALATLPRDDDGELALEQGRRWLRGRSGAPADGAALGRHLARKGFGRRAIFRVLNELLPGTEPPPELD